MHRTKQVIAFALMAMLTLVTTGGSASAQGMAGEARHKNIGLGFHDVSAPVGVRWWLSGQKVGIDVGLGFNSEPADLDPDETELGWALDLGVPFVVSSWDRAHVNVRPGLMYRSQEVGFIGPGPAFDFETENATLMSLSLEIEAEVFLADAVSVSVGHGLSLDRFTPADDPFTAGDESDDDSSSFGTFGRTFGGGVFSNEFTVGFHVYFLGSGQ